MNDEQARWLALYVLCLGDLMIVLDTNIVNVALPSIQADLGFSPTALAWGVDAYMLTFGGFLLLSGRLISVRVRQQRVSNPCPLLIRLVFFIRLLPNRSPTVPDSSRKPPKVSM